jgi:hypothetical protein
VKLPAVNVTADTAMAPVEVTVPSVVGKKNVKVSPSVNVCVVVSIDEKQTMMFEDVASGKRTGATLTSTLTPV